ncbi:MAG TPA: carbon-nitrogen hydrolase family protein [Streptosporangiaceae bacterium]|nr:carbon-nitrogen hydrolase family protein [Streptosporangiaceae bacterium]
MADKLPRLRLAAVQAAPVWLDRDGTVDKACALIADAGRGGADIAGFPENFIPGHPVWYYFHPATSQRSQEFAVELFKNAVEVPSPATDKLCAAAAHAGIDVVIGLTEKRPGTTGTLYNTQLFIGRDGRILGRHRKLVPTVGERLVHCPGDAGSQGAVQCGFGPVSGLICGENSNPLAIAALSAQYPFVHVASWPNHFIPAWCGMQETSLLASRNVAYMNKSYVISSCGMNSDEMRAVLPLSEEDAAFLADPSTSGGSAIIDPLGGIVAGPIDGSQERIIYADTDLDLMIRGRLVHDFVGHYNRPDIFHLQVRTRQEPLLAFTDGMPSADSREIQGTVRYRPASERTGDGKTSPGTTAGPGHQEAAEPAYSPGDGDIPRRTQPRPGAAEETLTPAASQ